MEHGGMLRFGSVPFSFSAGDGPGSGRGKTFPPLPRVPGGSLCGEVFSFTRGKYLAPSPHTHGKGFCLPGGEGMRVQSRRKSHGQSFLQGALVLTAGMALVKILGALFK